MTVSTRSFARLAAAALMVFALGSAAATGSATASFIVRIDYLPIMKQSMLAAEIKVRQPDGTFVALTPQQRARYVEEPASLLPAVRRGGDSYVVVRIEF